MALGAVFFMTPIIGWTWPALVPILTAAGAGLGYKMLNKAGERAFLRGKTSKQLDQIKRVTLPLDTVLSDIISEDLGNEERLQFTKDDIMIVFRKDARGKFFVDVSGPRKHTKLDLEIRGEEFATELIRKFAFHKMVEQIERRGATVVEEEVKEDGSITIRARQWR